jgi:predicted SAM-dependent methyltransferase
MREKFRYYVRASYRRKLLDRLQEQYQGLYRGTVLDIGGRSRGRFKKPKDRVDRWIFADVEARHGPDLVLDVGDMKGVVEDGSIDVVNAIELFEHVYHIDQALEECWRVLKPGGHMIISVPFLYAVHADPYDFQRWTRDKWQRELQRVNFEIESVEVMGRFFTIVGEMTKALLRLVHPRLMFLAYAWFPLVDGIVALDRLKSVQEHPRLGRHHAGYFMVVRKPGHAPAEAGATG